MSDAKSEGASAEPRSQIRQRQPVKDIIGAFAYGDRPGDSERRERVSKAGLRLLKWMAGGGLGVYATLRMMSFGEEWVRETWKQNAVLTEKLERLTDSMHEVAVGQQKVVDRIDLLLTVKAGEEAKPSPKPVRVRPVQ